VLPRAPADFGVAVAVPAAKKGGNAKEHAFRLLGAVRQANGRLENDRAFYEGVRTEFGAP